MPVWTVLFSVLLLAAVTLTSTTAFAESADTSAKHYTVGVTYLPDGVDAANGWALTGDGIAETVYMQDANGDLYSRFVDTATREDDTTWKLTLKQGVKFSDGSEVDAYALADCMNEGQETNGGTSTCGKITSTADDTYELTMTTERPTPVLQSALCEMNSFVYKTLDDGTAVYTGPWMPTAVEAGYSIDATPNPYYDDQAANRPDITLLQFSDSTSMQQAFESGELDMAYALTPEASNQLKEEGYHVLDFDGGYQYFAILNEQRVPLDDLNVRKAISLVMDRSEMVDALYGCLPATGFFGHKFAFNADIDFQTDVEQAKQYLADAGYTDTDGDGYVDKDGKNLSFEITTYNMHPELPSMMLIMASELEKAGIQTTTNILDGGMDKFAGEGNYDLILYGGYTGNTSDPATKLNAFFKTGGSTNYNGYSNPDVDAMLEKLDNCPVGDERNQIAIDIQEKVAEDVPVIYLIDSQFHAAVIDELANYAPYGGDYYIINDQFGLN